MKQEISKSIKALSFVMAILILILSMPVSAFAGAIGDTQEAADEIVNDLSETNMGKNEVFVIGEDENLREENIKHFKLSDGTTKAVVYADAVHYKDSEGKWIDIDNSLTLNGNEYSASNKTEIKFANKSGSNGLVSIKDGEYKISFSPINTNKVTVEIENPQKTDSRKFEDVSKLNDLVSKAVYKNIYDGIDIEYILVGNNIKENIIVNEKKDSYTFSFELELSKLKAELVNNEIILSDYDSGNAVYKIPCPYMLDASGEHSQSVEYSLTQSSKWKYTFTVTANAQWINSEERVFPVTVDPMVVEDTLGEDTYVLVDDVDYSTFSSLIIGNFMYCQDAHAYIKFNNLPGIPQGNVMFDAKLQLFASHITGEEDIYVAIYQAMDDWTNGLLYENRGSVYSESSHVYTGVASGTGSFEMNIKSAYQGWLDGETNHGLCLKVAGLQGSTAKNIHFQSFESVDVGLRPRLEISYSSTVGVEDYYGYVTTPLGNSGVGYVNAYNGSLTYINHLTTVNSGDLTYDINMVYNSIEGRWYPSFSESLTLYENYGITSYIWRDPDGTSHCFSPYLQKGYFGQIICYEQVANGTLWAVDDPITFYPEDDIDYVLTKTQTGELILKDYDGNQRLFDANGRLLRICDAQGNVLHINNCLGENNIASIYIETESGDELFLLEMIYLDSGKLARIIDNQNQKTIRFIWWTDGRLYSVSYYNTGATTAYKVLQFNYDNAENFVSVFDNSINQKVNYSIDNKNTEVEFDDEKIVEYQYGSGNQGEITKKIVIGNGFYRDLGEDLVFNTEDDIISAFTFDERGRKSSSTQGSVTVNYTYDDSILPNSLYYEIEYSHNIHDKGFNLVKHDMITGEDEFLSLGAQNISDINTISTTVTDNGYGVVENTTESPYKMVCQILVYYDELPNIVSHSTGFLCGSNAVMLSGHALLEDVTDNNVRDFAFPSKIEVIPGQYVDEKGTTCSPFGMYEVTTCYIQKEYRYIIDEENPESHMFDWAVCTLNGNIGEQLGYFDIKVTPDNVSNQHIEILGYLRQTKTMYWSKGKITDIDYKRIIHNALDGEGISGSPIFLNNGSYTVYGVHTSESGGVRISSLMYSLVDFLNE